MGIRTYLFAIALMSAALAGTGPARAQAGSQTNSNSEEVRTALAIAGRLEDGDLGGVYDKDLSDTFRALVGRDLFIQQMGMVRMQGGGRAKSRELVGSQAFTQTPTGKTGVFRYIRFRTLHPNGLVFQDIYLERVGTAWKLMGYYLLPAPQQ